MKNAKTTGTSKPTAHITVNKNRLKKYTWGNHNNKELKATETLADYYLKDGQTFEIELYNPTQDVLKADILLNGAVTSGGGLVIKPGERIYLERYVEDNNKFVFETYEVEDTEEVKQATSNNGSVYVKFYKEKMNLDNLRWVPNYPPNRTYYYDNTRIGDNTSINTTNFMNVSDTTSTSMGFIDMNTTLSTSSMTFDTLGDVQSNTVYNNEMDMVFEENGTEVKKKETGRIGKGEESSQRFTDYAGSFETFAFHRETMMIKPVSEQPLDKKDVHKMRKYCGQCGSKTKPKDNFCRMCGDKL